MDWPTAIVVGDVICMQYSQLLGYIPVEQIGGQSDSLAARPMDTPMPSWAHARAFVNADTLKACHCHLMQVEFVWMVLHITLLAATSP